MMMVRYFAQEMSEDLRMLGFYIMKNNIEAIYKKNLKKWSKSYDTMAKK